MSRRTPPARARTEDEDEDEDEDVVTEHLIALWARAGGADDPESLVVGAFRSVLARPGSPTRRALLDAVDALARRQASGAVTALGGVAAVPALSELPADRVRQRVLTTTDPAPTLTARRPGRTVLTAVLVVALLGLAVVVGQQRRDAPPVQADRFPADPADPAVSAVNQVEVAADAAARATNAAEGKIAAQFGFVSTGDLLLDQHLARCALAVADSGRRGQYPPVNRWVVTASQVGRTGVATAINGRLFCATTPDTVAVSATTGTPAGPVTLVRVGLYEVGVLKPGPGALTVVVGGVRVNVTEPATLIGVSGPSTPVAVVASTGPTAAPVPVVPAATAFVFLDRGPPYGARTSPAGRRLQACLSGTTGALVPDHQAWIVVDDSRPQALLVAAHGMVGVCVSGPGGAPQVMTVQPVPDPPAAGTLAVAINLGAVAGAAESYLVLSVDPDATRIGGDRGGVPLRCTVNRGVGLCAARSSAPGLTRLTATTLNGAVVAGPVRR